MVEPAIAGDPVANLTFVPSPEARASIQIHCGHWNRRGTGGPKIKFPRATTRKHSHSPTITARVGWYSS